MLGGGLVPGSCVLVGGDPGVGKSTLLLQLADLLASVPASEVRASLGLPPDDEGSVGGDGAGSPAHPVLYASGEESAGQVGGRAARLGLASVDGVTLLCSTDLEDALDEAARRPPRAIVVDSVQTVYLSEAGGYAGSVAQVRECARATLRLAKETGCPAFLVGHVTKSGEIAGPKVLEHMVDAVVYLEAGGGIGARCGPRSPDASPTRILADPPPHPPARATPTAVTACCGP